MLTEQEMLMKAVQLGIDEELVSYAKQIKRQLETDGDTADWLDCLEMAYNELIFNELY
jgi:hypothetical protein